MANLIDEYLKAAIERKASDLHLVVGKPPILRIDGELVELGNCPVLTEKSAEDIIYPILTPLQKERFDIDRELDLSYKINNLAQFRVNLHFERDNIGLVARVISSQIPTMEELDMPPIAYQLVREKEGLILVTGPSGCGKSTALASMIELINQERSVNIITLEDPIEFVFKSGKSIIKQRQLGNDMLSFADALKHVLRQDPDIIMVGEMRDLETISATVTLAETGHLVLDTLHTYNAAQTIDRIIDIYPSHQQNQIRLQLSITLKGIISQRLLPRIGGGRIAAREILINNSAISNIIRENKISQIETFIQTSSRYGMVPMDHELKRLYEEGIISERTAGNYLLDTNIDGLVKSPLIFLAPQYIAVQAGNVFHIRHTF